MLIFVLKIDFSLGLTLLGAALGGPSERKVPPRTPPQRLETLQRFFKEYIDGNVRPDRPDRANNQKEAVDRIYLPLQESFDAVKPDGSGLRRCSFFDPSVPNGGPRPVSATNTRAAEDWVAKLLCQFDGLTGPQCDTKRKRRSDIDTYDPFDDYEAQLENGERATAAVRLSNDKALALRQVNIQPKMFFRPKNDLVSVEQDFFLTEIVFFRPKMSLLRPKMPFFRPEMAFLLNIDLIFEISD